MRKSPVLLLCLSLLFACPVCALARLPLLQNSQGAGLEAAPEERSTGEEATGGKERPSEEFPGLGQVIPRQSRLGDDRQRVLLRVEQLERTPAVDRQLQAAREEYAAIIRQGSQLGEMADWSVYRLEEVRGRLAEQKDALQRILDTLSERIHEAELLRSGWQNKQEYWKKWQAALDKRRLEVPDEAFARADDQIAQVLERLGQAIGKLVILQQEIISLRSDVQTVIERASAALRQDTMRQGARTFFDPAFYRQFDAGLWQRTRKGIVAVEGPDGRFLREQGWILLLQLLAVLGIAVGVSRYRRKVEDTEEWGFILEHPWSTGIFAAFAFLSPLYGSLPGLWRLGLWVPGAWSASILVAALLNHRWKARMAYLLATLFILSLGLQLISFPQPLYRVYLALVSLAGVPLLFTVGRRVRRTEEKSAGFVFIMQAGALILLVSLVAQIGGYSTFSFRLIESSIQTVFLILIAIMVIELAEGGIDFVLSRPFLRRWRFFRRFGRELDFRLTRVLRVVVIVYSTFYLLKVWGLFESVSEGWQEVTGLGMRVGEVEITLEMVLVAVVAIYASTAASWGIRSVLEAEVFPRQAFDRGIRDSIKKILHYCFIVFGVFLALMVTGVELKNFAVLAGAFGIGIGFGLQNIVNNFVSGLILLFERPIKVGDLLIVDEEWGSVRKIGLRSTVVTTLDESEIIVPNSMLISEKVTNWSLSSPLCRVTVPVGVAYGSDVPLVLEILTGVGGDIDEVMEDPEPSALFSGFGNSSLDFELRVWISDVRDRLRVRSAVCQYVDRRFREEGVEIPFPQRDLHLRSVADKVFGRVGEETADGKDRAEAAEGNQEVKKASPPKGTTPGEDEHEGREQARGDEQDGDGGGNGAD